MKPLHRKFDELLSHLNSEENEMALELRHEIKLAHIKAALYDEATEAGAIDESRVHEHREGI